MGGFPVAVGAKSVSSRPVAPPAEPLQEEFKRDDGGGGATLHPVRLEQNSSNNKIPAPPIVATATTADLQAVVTVHYYDTVRNCDCNGDCVRNCDCCDEEGGAAAAIAAAPAAAVVAPPPEKYEYDCTAELRVQLSPAAEPLSSAHRDALHRVPLPRATAATATTTTTEQQQQQQSSSPSSSSPSPSPSSPSVQNHQPPAVTPQVVISADQTFLTCLLPHPHCSWRSVVVVLELRRPRQFAARQQQRIHPPLPSYVPRAGHDETVSATAVATRPRLLCRRRRRRGGSSTEEEEDGTNSNENNTNSNDPQPLLDATCLCDVATTRAGNDGVVDGKNSGSGGGPAKSLLLVGCRDGRLRAAAYRPPLLVESPLHDFNDGDSDSDDSDATESDENSIDENDIHSSISTTPSFPTALHHLTEWNNLVGHNDDDNNDSGGSSSSSTVVGRLAAVLDDGSVSVFRSHLQFGDLSPSPVELCSQRSQQHGNGNHHRERSVTMNGHGPKAAPAPPTAQSTPSPSTPLLGAIWINLTETHRIPPPGAVAAPPRDPDAVRWVAGTYLALAQRPSAGGTNSRFTVHVYGLYDLGRAAPVSTLHMTWDRLNENAHTAFCCGGGGGGGSSDCSTTASVGRRSVPHVALDYDPVSDSIAVSAFLWNKGRHNNSDDDGAAAAAIPFVCLWSWRTNSQGFTAKAAGASDDGYSHTNPFSSSRSSTSCCCVSRLFFARDSENRRVLAHFVATSSTGTGGQTPRHRLRKELYETALLSPPHERCVRRAALHPPNSLLLSALSVSYPTASPTSPGVDNLELRWSESVLPSSYVAAFGAPQVAAIGSSYNRSIAVASSRGFCILDCSGAEKSIIKKRASERRAITASRRDELRHTFLVANGETTAEDRDAMVARLLRSGNLHPRWSMFGNEADERRFRVVSMAWWEGLDAASTKAASNLLCDDVLVAVVEVLDDKEGGGFYLSCWPSSNVDLKSQLLCPFVAQQYRGANEFKWGTRLSTSFTPVTLDLLRLPSASESATGLRRRKAVVLLADASYSTSYLVYQLQIVPYESSGTVNDAKQYGVVSRCGATGSIGSPVAKLFLAGASATFDLIDESPDRNSLESQGSDIATIGVVRLYGAGVDAISVSPSGIVAAGQVVSSADSDIDDPLHAELSSFWLADIIYNLEVSSNGTCLDFFVWVLQLANGQLLSWSVPFALTEINLHFMIGPTPALLLGGGDNKSRIVHPKGIILGTVCDAGSTSSWMQRSARGARTDFLVGHVPRSSFGCVLGVSQSCRKLHRSLGEEFEGELFRPDFLDHEIMCPGDFALYPPGCLASLYSLVHASVTAHIRSGRDFDYFNRHVWLRMNAPELQNTTIMSFELLIIRSVEKIAAIRGMSNTMTLATAKGMLSSLVATVREVTTPLQFTILFLKIGRQIEPSCLPHLFPLPIVSSEATGGETMDDLFAEFLANGSISMSVAALPLLANSETTSFMCAATFHHCLNALHLRLTSPECAVFHCQANEGRDAAADIFRYALKLCDPEGDDHKIVTDDSDDEDDRNPRSYSIMCGMTKFFSRKPTQKTETKSSHLMNGISKGSNGNIKSNGSHSVHKLSAWQCTTDESFQSVAAATARYIVAAMFDSDAHTKKTCLRRLGTFAALLIGDERTGYRFCSSNRFNDLVRGIKPGQFAALLPVRQNGGLVKFFKQSMINSSQENDSDLASSVFDLVLLLLGLESKDLEDDIPGLILASIVSGHASGRITDIMTNDTGGLFVWVSYVEAHTELAMQIARRSSGSETYWVQPS